MKTIKRIFNNLKWLLNHPPTGYVNGVPEGSKCKYCGRTDFLFSWVGFCYCKFCLEKCMDKSLSKIKKK
jgi:hypothetical protein